MKRREVREIVQCRFAEWARVLVSNHATPAIVLGMGHDHTARILHICVPGNLSRAEAIGILKAAVRMMEDGSAHDVVDETDPGQEIDPSWNLGGN